MNRLNKTESAILVSLMCSLLPEDLHSELICSGIFQHTLLYITRWQEVMSVRNQDGFTPMKSLIQKAPEAALVNTYTVKLQWLEHLWGHEN